MWLPACSTTVAGMTDDDCLNPAERMTEAIKKSINSCDGTKSSVEMLCELFKQIDPRQAPDPDPVFGPLSMHKGFGCVGLLEAQAGPIPALPRPKVLKAATEDPADPFADVVTDLVRPALNWLKTASERVYGSYSDMPSHRDRIAPQWIRAASNIAHNLLGAIDMYTMSDAAERLLYGMSGGPANEFLAKRHDLTPPHKVSVSEIHACNCESYLGTRCRAVTIDGTTYFAGSPFDEGPDGNCTLVPAMARVSDALYELCDPAEMILGAHIDELKSKTRLRHEWSAHARTTSDATAQLPQ